MLSRNWSQRRPHYDVLVIGSGYGGAIAAARLASADVAPKRSVCILERGKEWPVGSFPDRFDGLLANQHNALNPLGLYELLNYRDISVIQGSGLGGTSLVNANVAIVPDAEVFGLTDWPKAITREALLPYYRRAAEMLRAMPHPRAAQLEKVQRLDDRARQLGLRAQALELAVNFDIDGANPHGAMQKPCTDCGDCVTGCNVGAKNTLYMNYLPMARNAGAEVFTQTKVEWIEKRSPGWRVHGRYFRDAHDSEPFTLDAGHVVLAAGAIHSTGILLRSEMHGLRLSPRVGSGFGGNGDFFGLAYNGDRRADVLGFGNHPDSPWKAHAPGPTIVGAVRYNGAATLQRMTIEDLSFPNGYVDAARAAFGLLRGDDSDIGDEAEELRRLLRDTLPFSPRAADGALNHTMLYLCMGFDDAQGRMVLETTWQEPGGRVRIDWDEAGHQIVFRRINEELRRHARAQGAKFIQNPMWEVFNLRHLITAHPLGGCPIGEDYLHGAVDPYGRVYSGDGLVHDGLLVTDGSLVPSALGVNPFLTISALAERIAERKIEEWQGKPYPAPARAVAGIEVDPVDATHYSEAELERLFRRSESKPMLTMMNSGTRSIDLAAKRIHNDEFWKGFFPRRHVLNEVSAAIFTGFKKRFFLDNGRAAGVTSDTDDRIKARNSLEQIVIQDREGDLEPGRYVLLRYVDPPWQGYYDIFKVVSDNLLVGRVYLGAYPHGVRLFTFAMTREYGLKQMTVEDHRKLWAQSAAPAVTTLEGVWRMDTISNANTAAGIANLAFAAKPDGRLEARYRLLGLLEGLVLPSQVAGHFRLDDFTPFHDEIREVTPDLLVGKYVAEVPAALAAAMPAQSLGVLHAEDDDGHRRFGFYYLLTRMAAGELPPTELARQFLELRVPDGVGMTFDEEMVGWYQEGIDRPTSAEQPPAAGLCRFRLRMHIADINEFVDGVEHEARAEGSIEFDRFAGFSPAVMMVNPSRSRFHYLRLKEQTQEGEMRYLLEFPSLSGTTYLFDGRKYMQKDRPPGGSFREVLDDYTTLYYRVTERAKDGTETVLGGGSLKFRTFEDLAAVGNLAGFLRSFAVTGTSDPVIRLQAQMRFLAFTGQFVQREYDPIAPPLAARGGR